MEEIKKQGHVWPNRTFHKISYALVADAGALLRGQIAQIGQHEKTRERLICYLLAAVQLQ